MSSNRTFGALIGLSLLGATVIPLSGCGSPGSPSATDSQPAPELPRQDGMTAREIMTKMVDVYRHADVYVDNAEYGEHFVLAGEGKQRQGPPLTVAVQWKRPNKFRITRIEPHAEGPTDAAVVTSDGETLEASISRLEPQRLSVPAPQVLTVESIAPDPLLRQALFPVPLQDMFPQLALLLASDGETPWPLAADEGLVLLPAQEIHARGSQPLPCYRVQVPTTMGPQICWIDKQTFVLLRIEMPSEALRQEVYPDQEFTDFSWRFDFYDVTLDAQLPSSFFQLDAAEDAPPPEMVTAFHERSEAQDPKADDAEKKAETAEKENGGADGESGADNAD